MENRRIRIPIDITSEDKTIQFKLEDEFDSLDILSLNITSNDEYTREKSDFGVIVGRVTTSTGFGLQNAKVTIFIPITEEDKLRNEIIEIYPFETVNDSFPNGVRYNLFPRIRNDKNSSHRAIGNFPDKTDFSHYPQYLEIMDKYYKYTTITNESGDYMIFGAPIGQHHIIMDFDLFDTSSFNLTANDLVEQISLNKSIANLEALMLDNATSETIDKYKVPNFIYKGNNNYEVDVKTSIDNMPNIFHEVRQIMVSSFWGDSTYDIGITRCDFKIDFIYTPTAIFFGFLETPSGGFCINSDYSYNITEKRPEIPANNSGDIYPFQKLEVVVYRLDDSLTLGSRKRLGVFTGSHYNGIFRITLPMYMDYYIMNEFGDLVPTIDTTIGIPTKGYYAFEIYDTDDAWTGRRIPWGGFSNPIVPGIRIPSTTTGDVYLGGWSGTWNGLFEYDILQRKRKFYTVKTIYNKHSLDNVLLSGDYIGYFPQYNPDKANIPWNFPLSYDSVTDIETPTIIGSVLVPRIYTEGNFNGTNYFNFNRPNNIVYEPWKPNTDTYNEWIQDYEMYLGLGVQAVGGTNSGTIYTDLFKAEDFIKEDGYNFFGDVDTWNWGDNTKIVFNASLFASEMANKVGSKANSFKVHPAFNQVTNDDYTYGVFINSVDFENKKSIMEIFIYDITDELSDLIDNSVYSSYMKGDITEIKENELSVTLSSKRKTENIREIFVVDKKNTDNLSTTINKPEVHSNTYKGNFYYFGLWNELNALYDIEKNYFIK